MRPASRDGNHGRCCCDKTNVSGAETARGVVRRPRRFMRLREISSCSRWSPPNAILLCTRGEPEYSRVERTHVVTGNYVAYGLRDERMQS